MLIFPAHYYFLYRAGIPHYPFALTKAYANELKIKLQSFRDETKTKKHLILVLLSVHGVQENEYSRALLNSRISLEDILKYCK